MSLYKYVTFTPYAAFGEHSPTNNVHILIWFTSILLIHYCTRMHVFVKDRNCEIRNRLPNYGNCCLFSRIITCLSSKIVKEEINNVCNLFAYQIQIQIIYVFVYVCLFARASVGVGGLYINYTEIDSIKRIKID